MIHAYLDVRSTGSQVEKLVVFQGANTPSSLQYLVVTKAIEASYEL